MSHQAAWIREKGSSIEIGPSDTPMPGPLELLVKVECIAFSPIEFKMQKFEIHPYKKPNILGFSYAGTVEKIGTKVTDFSEGDRVVTLRPEHTLDDFRYGAFQQYAIAAMESTAKLLPENSFEAAAASILNLVTIAGALSLKAGLDRPVLHATVTPTNQKVLIYGGSSSSGGLAVRYAKAAGYTVITTASPTNKEYVASLSPDHIIDHTLPEEDVIAELRSKGPYHCILDTIGVAQVTNIMVEYLSKLGGGSYLALIPALPGTKPIPENIDRHFESYGWLLDSPQHEGFRTWFYTELLPVGLASGVIVPTRPQWLEGGLSEVQTGLDMMASGKVSGYKLVMNPWH